MRRLCALAGLLPWVLALSMAGCRPAQPPAAAMEDKASTEATTPVDEARQVAEASLGKGAEVLARGDLALNGSEQLLVVNRLMTGAPDSNGDAKPAAIFVRRAAVLEKDDGKWSQILLCDENLKNSSGYLENSSAGRVNGWRLNFAQDANAGLEMKFTPAERLGAENVNTSESSGPKGPVFDVRWNKSAKRYQRYDQSHERYLSEVPSLEIPESTLK